MTNLQSGDIVVAVE